MFTLNAPSRIEKDLIACPVSFLFADDHRLSFIGGEQALVNIIISLFISAEHHYGTFAVRLFCAFNSTKTNQRGKFQVLNSCGIF